MREGKLPEEILRRAVLQTVQHRREEVLFGPGIGADCAILQTTEEEVLLFSVDPITGAVQGIGGHSIHITANDLAAAGAEPVAVLLTILCPASAAEEEIAAIMQEAEAVCADLNMEILGGHTEITSVVQRPLMTATGIGKCEKDALLLPEFLQPGLDVVLSKWIGLEATAILANEREEALRSFLPQEILQEAKGFSNFLSIVPEAKIAKAEGAVWMHDVTEGGLAGALWEIAEAGDIGLEIEREKIPLRDETKEICSLFSADPYRIMSSGSLLMVVPDGEKLVSRLRDNRIPATVIGKTVAEKREWVTPTGRSPLCPPDPDALYAALTRSPQAPKKK